jgi:hypothetical protein
MKQILFLLGIFFTCLNSKAQTIPFCFNDQSLIKTQYAGTNPRVVLTEDLNSDGIIDIVTGNAGNISILIGTGNGNFAWPVNYFVGSSPSAIASADFNGDGNLDLAVTNAGSNNISILKGNGNGTFLSATNYNVGTSPKSVTANDFNNDGKIDLAIANQGTGYTIFIGIGNGTFGGYFNPGVNGALSIVSGDFNSDGKIDLATANGGVNTISVLIGTGTYSFSPAINYTVGTNPIAITSADFNSDGKIDLASTNNGSNDVSVLTGIGNGAFLSVVNYSCFPGQSIVSCDLDLDGKSDLAVCGGAYQVAVLMSLGSTGFGSAIYSNTGHTPYAIAATDFNNDGKPDLITANSSSDDVSLLTGFGSDIFSPVVNYNVGDAPFCFTSADFNKDGSMDLVSVNYGSSNISVLNGSGNGTFASAVNYPITGGQPYAITAADFNGDNNTDLAVTVIQGGNNINILLGSNSGTFAAATSFTVLLQPSSITSADFNGDGNADLAVTNDIGSIASGVSILIGNGTGAFTSAGNYTVGLHPRFVNYGDFNNDGKIDLAVATASNVAIMLGSGTGSFGAPTNYAAAWGACSINIADFDADGNIDLAVANETSGNVSILKGNGTGAFAAPVNYPVGIQPYSVTSADFNVDGFLDVAVTNGQDCNFSILTGSSGGTFSSEVKYDAGTTAFSILTNDFDGDGKPDIAVSNLLSDNITILLNKPLIALTSPSVICAGNSATITASGANTYSWNTAATTNSISVSPLVNTTYSVTGITLNGCNSFGVKTITVSSSPLPTITVTSNAASICIGSNAMLVASGANTYVWNTGAGVPNVTVNPVTNSTYTVTGTDANNCYNTQTVSITVDNTCADVWPGDANSDGTTDNLDVLELGLHFTQTGSPRATTNNNWQSYFANNWTGTITNGKNLNHSDCNGDGNIDFNDTLAIHTNYGLTHAFKPVETTTVNPQLSIVPDQAMVTKGSWGTASIYLGDAVTSISNINGVAFTINFENTLIEPNGVWIEYPNSFLNPSNQNLHFRKLDFVNGNLYTATTHTNNININGNGLIGVLHYQILSNLSTDQVLNISLSQTNQSSASGAVTPLTSGTGTLMAIGASVGLKENSMNASVVISPNPTNGIVNIGFYNLSPNTTVEVYNTVGALVLSENIINKNSAINISDMNTGLYFIKVIENGKVVTVKKIIRD